MKVHVYDNLQVAQTGAPNVSFSAGSGPNAQQIEGQQMQALGEAGQRAGDAMSKIALDEQAKANDLAARSLDIDAATKLDTLQFDPQNGFMNKRGGDAAASLGDFAEKARQVRNDVLGNAPNPAVRQAVDRIVTDRTMSATASMQRHAGAEYQKFQVQTSDDRAKVSIQTGANDFTNEPAFQANLGTALHEAQAQADMLGWDAVTTKLQGQKYMDDAYRLRYEAWRVQDPVGALAHFQQNANAISPVVRVQLYHQLFEASAPSLALQINQAGGVGVVAPTTSASGTPDGPQPRGIRNNNPGNIVQSSTPWQGAVQGNDPRFVSFETPEAGIRAMGKTLLTYQDTHGLNTVGDIISRWAPATENDTMAYTQQVAKALGVKADQPIDLHDSATLASLTKAMIKVENGRQPYTDQQIALGLSSTDGPPPTAGAGRGLVNPLAIPGAPVGSAAVSANAWRDPSIPTGNALVDSLPADWKLHVLQLARTQAQQDMAGARDLLRTKVQDASASYMVNGFAPNPPTLAEFVQASGQVEGQAQYAQFQNLAKLGQQLQQVKTLPAATLATLVEQSKPVPGPGFAAAQHNYEILTQAVDHTNKLRQQDPIGYALDNGAYRVQPIDFTNPQKMTQQLVQRTGVAPQLSSDYGVAPTVLSRGETQVLSDTLRAAPVETQKTYLAAIATGVASMPMLKTTMQAIAPDQPVMALAGIYQARGFRTDSGRDVADLMLRGQAILTPNKKTDGTGHEGGASLLKMPEGRLLLSEFNSATGSAFAGKEQAADLFMQASRAIYAAKSAEAGDYSGNLDAGRWKSAISLATGGIASHNGSNILLPYGMSYDTFQAQVKAQAPALAALAVNTQPDELRRLPVENVGDGRYLFKRGAGYLVDKDGRPVVANFNPQ